MGIVKERSKNVITYVFSFNRGVFLDNCLNSIARCVPDVTVIVLDDNSTDTQTLEVLNKHRKKAKVISVDKNDDRFNGGGLHNNMNYALNYAYKKGFKYALFIQDDMQLVRKVSQKDLDAASHFFKQNKNSFLLNSCFLKSEAKDYDTVNMYISDCQHAYFRKPQGGGRFAGFADVGLFFLPRFFDIYGKIRLKEDNAESNIATLQGVERLNNIICEKKGIQMGFYAFPFMMWLPLPITYRGRKRNLYLKMKEVIGGAGFYPFDYMEDEKTNDLFTRDLSVFPYAEDWLSCPGLPPCKEWRVIGGNYTLIARGGWRRLLGKILNRIERKIEAFKTNN